jgi:hypothetical protein
MSGGIAVRGNLLCVTWTAARGHVFLFDLEACQRVSSWVMPEGPGGYSDAAGVAMDEHYHLFVADPHNDRVCHWNAFGRLLSTFGAAAPAVGDAGRDRPGVLDRPCAVARVRDLLLVAGGDAPRRHAVQRFATSGTLLKGLACRGDPEQKFGAPRGLFADAEGSIVADTQRGVLQCFRGDGTFLREIACAAPSELARPVAVLRRPDDSYLFVDRGDRTGVRWLGHDGRTLVTPTDLAWHCHDPIALCSDARGRVFVLDRGGERVLQFTAELAFERVVIDLEELQDDPPAPT